MHTIPYGRTGPLCQTDDMALTKNKFVFVLICAQLFQMSNGENLNENKKMEIKGKLFKRLWVETSSIIYDKFNTTLGVRTLVECVSFCLMETNCSALVWEPSKLSCNSVIAENLIADETFNESSAYIDTSIKPVDGVWSEWGDWSECNCADQSRSRLCFNPTHGGKRTCPLNVIDLMIRTCNTCPSAMSKVLVAFRYLVSTGDVEIIDLSSDQTTCSKPRNFPYTNYDAAGGLTFQDKPIICGGPNMHKQCNIYENGTWKMSYSLNRGRIQFQMTRSPFRDGKSSMFLTGGYDSGYLRSTEILMQDGWQISVPMPVAVKYHCMVNFNLTSVVVTGGSYDLPSETGNCFIFNSEANLWTEGPRLINARGGHSCGMVRTNNETQDKSLIVAGGYTGGESSGVFQSSVEVLDLDLKAWRRIPDLPIAISFANMVEDPSGGVVLIGGQTSGGSLTSLYRLPDAGPETTWELMHQQLKMKRECFTAILVPDEVADCK